MFNERRKSDATAQINCSSEKKLSPNDFNRPNPESLPDAPSKEDQTLGRPKLPEGLPQSHGQPVPESTALAYIAKKLDPQRDWFDKKARRSKLFYYSVLGTSMIATSSIVAANSMHSAALSTALALIATVTTGFSGIIKFQDHWIRYRSTASALEGLKLRYEIGMHPFDGITKHGLLIEEAEKIFDREQSQWAAKSAENARQPSNRNIPKET